MAIPNGADNDVEWVRKVSRASGDLVNVLVKEKERDSHPAECRRCLMHAKAASFVPQEVASSLDTRLPPSYTRRCPKSIRSQMCPETRFTKSNGNVESARAPERKLALNF